MTAQGVNLAALQHQLADLVHIHPPSEWSPDLLRAVNGVIALYVSEHGLRTNLAPVLELVRR